MSDSPPQLLSPNPSPTIETPVVSPPPLPTTGNYQLSPPILPPPSPQTGTNQLSPPILPPPSPQTGTGQLSPPPQTGTGQLSPPPQPGISQIIPPPTGGNQLSPPLSGGIQLGPPPSGTNQLGPPPPLANVVTPPPPPELSQLPPPSPGANQITPAPGIAGQLSPPPVGVSYQLITPPGATPFTPVGVSYQLITPPPPPIASQFTPPPPVASESFPPPPNDDQLDPEFMETGKSPNPLLSQSIGNMNTSSPPPPVTVPVPAPPFQPLPQSVPPPPVDPLLTLAPPGGPVPVQVQPPPPGFPNQIVSPLTNPTDTASGPAFHVEPPPTQDSSTGGPKHDSTQATVGIALLVAFVLFFIMCIFVVFMKGLRRKRATTFPNRYKSKTNKAGLVSPTLSNLNSDGGFPYEQLYEMTAGFSEANLIGEGGFAHVYKGLLPNGTEVAVKQIKQEKAAEQELLSEMEIIGRIHHRHLVKFLGYCLSEQHQLLVYEFVPNQTLSYHLHEEDLPVLDWQERMKIAIGSARGLKYLHEDCEPKIVHRDIKSANILLDNCFEPKLADFGLAKLRNDGNTHISTRVMGTYGYLAPEYGTTGKLTYKSDVFSFGVVLLELITGRKAINPSDPEESLVEWAWPLLVEAIKNGNLEILVDPKLEGNYVEKEMRQMVDVAASCVRHSAANRPSMPQVLKALESGCNPSDLSNGVWFGDSTAFDSRQYSLEIENFQKREFGNAGVSITSS